MGNAGVLGQVPQEIYITAELDRRAPRAANHLGEKRALQDLAERMVSQPEQVLPRFVDLAMKLTGGIAAGLSLLEENPAPGVFRWRYLRGTLAPFENATTPRNFSPCGITLDQNKPVLSRHPERFYSWISDASIEVPEVLLVPLYIGGGEPLGTLWIVANTEGHFTSEDARVATELATFVGIALKMLRTEQKLQIALEEQETLAKEMSHRVKNLFAVAVGMVRVSEKSSSSKEEMGRTLTGRFHALASAHGLIRRSFSTTGAEDRVSDLTALLQMIFRPHENEFDGSESRFAISGPSITCGEHALNGIALIFHELATNAVKHGALTSYHGKIRVGWDRIDSDLVFKWTELEGPKLTAPPQSTGFGSQLLRDTVIRQFSGRLENDWNTNGLVVTVTIPAKSLSH